MLLGVFASSTQAQNSLSFDQCIDDIEARFEKLSTEARAISGFDLCTQTHFPWEIRIQLSVSPEKTHRLAQLFGLRTPGYLSMQIEGRVSYEIRPFTKDMWSVDVFDDHGNRETGQDFIWARDMSENARPFAPGALDWHPVKYFNCYRATSRAGDREGLNCRTRYHVTLCSRFVDKQMGETRFAPEFSIKVQSKNDASTTHLFEHYDEVHSYIEHVLKRLLEFSCS